MKSISLPLRISTYISKIEGNLVKKKENVNTNKVFLSSIHMRGFLMIRLTAHYEKYINLPKLIEQKTHLSI